jgi:glycosyltransferase involved in cell wall biosynthesis
VSGTDARPLVTVALPTFPSADRMGYLREAIESALAQTYPTFELIVSDNSSSPEVQALVASFDDPRLQYRHNGRDIGPILNALAAYHHGRGPLVTTLFDDDLWEPTFLEALVPPLVEDPSLTMAFCDHWVIGPDGAIDEPATEANTRLWHRDRLAAGVHRPFIDLAILDRAVPVGMGTVFRRSAIDWDDFPEEVFLYDLWLGYLAARDGGGAYYTPERLTRYRVHPGMMTSSTRYDVHAVYCYDRFLADPRVEPIRSDVLRESAGFHTGLGISLLEEGRAPEARRHLAWGLRHGQRKKAAVGLALSLLPVGRKASIERARQLWRRQVGWAPQR